MACYFNRITPLWIGCGDRAYPIFKQGFNGWGLRCTDNFKNPIAFVYSILISKKGF